MDKEYEQHLSYERDRFAAARLAVSISLFRFLLSFVFFAFALCVTVRFSFSSFIIGFLSRFFLLWFAFFFSLLPNDTVPSLGITFPKTSRYFLEYLGVGPSAASEYAPVSDWGVNVEWTQQVGTLCIVIVISVTVTVTVMITVGA